MLYIELNGKSSLDVQGLLIQSLPPITKPKMRTETTEIDGRDGDIVTRLGYSAYDRDVSIGLSWNYDIDEVIQYFVENDKGTVLFSNEEDKLYKYEILDQIDFEKLIRFKTAKVKFHVQPFKHSSIETAKTWSKLENSITGQNNTIENNDNTTITSIVIYGCTQKLKTSATSTNNMNGLVSVGEKGTINLYNDSASSKTYSIPISEPLRNLYLDNGVHDNAQDTLTSNGNIVRNVGKYIFTGEENWASDSANGYAYLMISSVSALSNVKPYGRIYSNYFDYGKSGVKGSIFIGDTAIAVNYNDNVTNLDSLKSFLKSHNVYCLYELKNEVAQPLTQEQNNVINSIALESGTNNLYLEKVNNVSPTFKVDYATSDSMTVRNIGNYVSRPTITLYGNGTINLYINNSQVLKIDLDENTQITIDSEKMEAYNAETLELMNRQVTGNYENIKLNVGKNAIKWDGYVTRFEISNFSRWI